MKTSYIKPLLPLRDIVIFPSMVVPLFVGRDKSIKALQEVMKSDKSIVLVTQKNSEIDDPSGKDLFQFGCLSACWRVTDPICSSEICLNGPPDAVSTTSLMTSPDSPFKH